MFKQHLKRWVESQPEETTDFEILKDGQARWVSGGTNDGYVEGCGTLRRCRNFTGDCTSLQVCHGFNSPSSLAEPVPKPSSPDIGL